MTTATKVETKPEQELRWAKEDKEVIMGRLANESRMAPSVRSSLLRKLTVINQAIALWSSKVN